MTSFLQRGTAHSGQNSGALRNLLQPEQLPHQSQNHLSQQSGSDSVSDIFSDFNNFRNETKRKVDTGNTRPITAQTESAAEGNRFSGFQAKSSVSQSNLLQNKSQKPQGFSINLGQSPPRSFLASKDNAANDGLNSSKHANQRNTNNLTSNLDQLRRDIRETAFERNFSSNSILGQQRPRTAQQDSPKSRRQMNVISPVTRKLGESPSTAANKRNSFSINKDSSTLLSSSSSRTRGASSNTSNLLLNGGLHADSSSSHANKLISYSPGKNSSKVFSPHRLLNRLNSSPHARFSELEFSSKPSSLSSQVPATPNNQPNSLSGNRSISQRRSSTSQLTSGLSSILSSNSISKTSNTPFSKQKLNLSTSSLSNSSSNNNSLHFNSSTVQSQASTSATYLADRKVQDLSDYLNTLSSSDFNALPRQNVEHLIKLSSVIMQKVKNSMFYKASIF